MEKYIDVDEVIANASTFIEDMSDELSLMMRQWVWMALRDIGPNYSDIGIAELEVTGGSAAKPDDMIGNFIDLGVYTDEGHEIPYRYNYDAGRTHEDNKIRTRIDIYEDFGFVHFSDFPVTPGYILVKYYKMPLDDCGLPKVPESYLNAVVAYLKFCYYYRVGNRSDMIMISKNHWTEERLKIRAKNKSVAGIRAEQMVRDWMTHIPKTSRKRF
jgi:hypothetical protein